jgi:5-methylcytosine-specific restriction endonuclease McrA
MSWDHRNRPGVRRFPPKIRRAVLHRDKDCQLALPGCLGASTEVDHIIGYADAQAAGWAVEDIDDTTNAQGVCRACHRTKSLAEAARGKARARASGKTNKRPPTPHRGLKPNSQPTE